MTFCQLSASQASTSSICHLYISILSCCRYSTIFPLYIFLFFLFFFRKKKSFSFFLDCFVRNLYLFSGKFFSFKFFFLFLISSSFIEFLQINLFNFHSCFNFFPSMFQFYYFSKRNFLFFFCISSLPNFFLLFFFFHFPFFNTLSAEHCFIGGSEKLRNTHHRLNSGREKIINVQPPVECWVNDCNYFYIYIETLHTSYL